MNLFYSADLISGRITLKRIKVNVPMENVDIGSLGIHGGADDKYTL